MVLLFLFTERTTTMTRCISANNRTAHDYNFDVSRAIRNNATATTYNMRDAI
jgi:hypothetical protein